MGIIGFIAFGLVVGVIARIIAPGKQDLTLGSTLLIGLLGSVAGGTIANAIGTGDIFELNILGSIVAIVVAVAFIGIAERLGLGTAARRARRRERRAGRGE